MGMVHPAVIRNEIFVADEKAICTQALMFGGELSVKLAILAKGGLFLRLIDPQIIPFSITD